MLPPWLAVLLLVAKALTKLQVLVKPVSTHLPESIGHPRFLAVILLLALALPRADAPKLEEQRRSLATPENYAVFWKRA